MKKLCLGLIFFCLGSSVRATDYKYEVQTSSSITKTVILNVSIDDIKKQRETVISLLIALENYYKNKKEEYESKLKELETIIEQSNLEKWTPVEENAK